MAGTKRGAATLKARDPDAHSRAARLGGLARAANNTPAELSATLRAGFAEVPPEERSAWAKRAWATKRERYTPEEISAQARLARAAGRTAPIREPRPPHQPYTPEMRGAASRAAWARRRANGWQPNARDPRPPREP